jgi:hypothetical protein
MSQRKKPYGEALKVFLDRWNELDKEGKVKLCNEYGIKYSTGKEWASTGIEDGVSTELTPLEAQVLSIVKDNPVSVGEISRQIDRSAETVIKTIDSLREKHYEVELDDITRQVTIPQVPSKVFEPTEFKYFKKFYRAGIVSDTQICSKYQQMTLLHDAYKDFDDRQVDFILHAGDLDDGQDMYRGHHNEIFKHGAKEHSDYIVENYPTSRRGRKTYLVGGQHDFCWFKQNGHNILETICEKRKDLVYRGFFDARFRVKGLEVGLHHPGGGVAYARSYKIQKYIENMIGFIMSTPSATPPILQLFGHWHIPCHLPKYMGVDAVSLPCFQSQTPYLAEKGLMPVVGYAVADIYLDKNDNLTSTKIEFVILNSKIIKGDY